MLLEAVERAPETLVGVPPYFIIYRNENEVVRDRSIMRSMDCTAF